MNIISLGELTAAFQSGGLRTVGLAAAGGLFFVTAQPRGVGEWMVLVTTRGKMPRSFRDPGKAILLLHEMGVKKIAVDISGLDPERAAAEGRKRPDVSARQRRAHEAAGVVGDDPGGGTGDG